MSTTEVITPDQLADRLGISVRSVWKRYMQERPHLRLDRRTLRFTEANYQEVLRIPTA